MTPTAPTVELSWVLGTVLVLVGPLYAQAAKSMLKNQSVGENESDIADNDEAINDLQDSLTRLEYEVQVIHRDMQVLHDLIAETNHCGAEDCRWCDRHGEE